MGVAGASEAFPFTLLVLSHHAELLAPKDISKTLSSPAKVPLLEATHQRLCFSLIPRCEPMAWTVPWLGKKLPAWWPAHRVVLPAAQTQAPTRSECQDLRPLQKVEITESRTRFVSDLNNSILSLNLLFWTCFILLCIRFSCVTLVKLHWLCLEFRSKLFIF